MTRIMKLALAAAAAFLLIQLIPYGHNHKNPSTVREPFWDSHATRALAKRVCFNCHSFETVWPWYSAVAPASWLVYYDVVAARKKLNFSDWMDGSRPGESPAVITHEIKEGDMPPFRYRIAHSEAQLSDDNRKKLAEGLAVTVKSSVK
jgi:mono/diheme cytochrome c family protein